MGRPLLGCAPLTPPLLCRPHSKALISCCAAVPMANRHRPQPQPRPHPSFEIVGGARELFLPTLTKLARPYNPFPLIGWNRHVETIFAAFLRSVPQVRYRRQCLRTKDDGAVALDWISGDDRLLPPDSPVLILLVRSLITFFSIPGGIHFFCLFILGEKCCEM